MLDVRHLVAHRTRLALSALGIAVGVALAVSVGSLTSSINGSLQAIAEAAATEANIEVRTNGVGGLRPEMLGAVREAPGVLTAGATIESYVKVRSSTAELRALVMGIDGGIIEMTPAAVDPEMFAAAGADLSGLFVPAAVAAELGVASGDEIEITTPRGWRRVKVGAVLPDESAEHTRVLVGTVGLLQQVLDRGATYDAIYVEASDPDAGLVEVQRAVGEGARVGPVAFRSGQVQQLLASANASFAVGTVVALFVGAFLVYNTMAMAAVERLQEAALLRAVGAKRRQVFALFITEGGLLGLVGSALGIVFGLGLTSQMLSQQ
ncbi:MAG: FtsX-like permease family protein, partial [Actinomycetota bacterium]